MGAVTARGRAGGGQAGRFIRSVALSEPPGLPPPDWSEYPWSLPIVAGLRDAGQLTLEAGVTFLVGDNGSGKSTLVEAIAVASGLNPEGGSRNFRFATETTESALGDYLRVTRNPGRERTSFFLRAESFYNVASEIDRLAVGDSRMYRSYGGRSLHTRSHGESFLDLLSHRFGPAGFYVMDEPEAALSPRGIMAAMRLVHELSEAGSQFLIATHSPILMALPGATILQIDGGRIECVAYDEVEAVQITRGFLDAPDRTLRHLFSDD
jgi:predicted ATPase